MSRNLDDWREERRRPTTTCSTPASTPTTRSVPKADAVMAATDLDALTRKRVDFESRINAIEKSNDVAALGTPEEQRTWARLKRIEDFLAMHPDDPDLAEMRDKAPSDERRHVLAAVRELQGAALERAAIGQGARGLAASKRKSARCR